MAGRRQETPSVEEKPLDAKNRYLNHAIGSCKGFGFENPSPSAFFMNPAKRGSG
jgi:hypothetical protein